MERIFPGDVRTSRVERETVLCVDDNADVRACIQRQLAERWNVVTAEDGLAALAAARAAPPDLIVADVIMPRLDGFALVHELRGDPRTRTIPIILLSARGGEARIDGFVHGADDYLIKPFSKRELFARIEARLEMVRIRRDAERESDALRRQLVDVIDSVPDSLVLVDREWRIVHANAAAEANGGYARANVVGKNFWAAFPDVCGSAFEGVYRRAMEERVASRTESFYPPRGRWLESEARPTADGGIAILSRDTTERRAHGDAARRLERERDALLARMQAIFERIPLAIVVTDPGLQIIDWNPAAERVFGYRRDEVIGQNGAHLFQQGDLEDHVISENVTKDGRTILCDWHNTPLRDADGQVIATFAMADDITARTQAEHRLRASESMLAEAQHVARVGSWSMEVASGAMTWSDEQYRLLGLVADGSATRDTAASCAHVQDRWLVETAVAQALCDHKPFDVSWRAVHGDGAIRFMHTRGEVEVDPDGQASRVFGYMQDVTDRVLAERVLIETQDNLAAELASMARLQDISTQLVHSGDGTVLLDKILDAAIAITAADKGVIQLVDDDGTLSFVASRGFDAAFLEHFASTHSGQAACGVAFREAERIVVEDITKSAMFADTPELDALLAAGVRAVQSTPLISRSGCVVGVLTTHYKISHRPAERDLHVLDLLARQACDWIKARQVQREREQLLEGERKAREEAERATRLKDDFLATLSHELRSPLSAIIGWTDVLRVDFTDVARVRRGVEVIARSARTQAQLVGDLLDLSRIITGKMRLDVSRVLLPDVIDAAVESVRAAAVARDIELECDIEPIIEAVHGDAARLQQIVWNLLSNAIKFTPEGGRVRLTLARANSEVEITVCDTGRGIDPDFLPYVFERFRQENASAAREHGGLGIGLALVKELTEQHGGRVSAHSDGEGQGATFTITLPLAFALDPQGQPRPHPRVPAALSLGGFRLAGVRVLVVDDEPDGLEVMERILEDRGVDVTAVRCTDDALATLAAQQFDVVLSDIGMPKRDGYELIAEVRKRGIATPAVAVTAFARSEDRARALLAGFHTHIAKPIEASELLATVASLAGRVTPA